MASIRIHADIANFERKRRGFTTRQIVSMVAAAGIFVGIEALFVYVLRLGATAGLYVALIPALLCILAGFFNIANMHFDRFCLYLISHLRRGRVIFYAPEAETATYPRGETREERKAIKEGIKRYRRYERSRRKPAAECLR